MPKYYNDIRSDAQGRQLIFNDKPQPASKILLHNLLPRTAIDRVALAFYDSIEGPARNYSYSDIENLSDQLAQDIFDAKISRKIIPVVIQQSPALYIAILGVLKSGNAYCPVLPDTARDRLEFICKDVEASLVITSLGPEAFATDLKLMSVPSIVKKTTLSYAVSISPDDLAYTMYTSGSTGTPKAVMISHSSASTSIMAHDEIFSEQAEGDKFLQFANSTFDISIFEIFSAWSRGMTLVSAERSLLISNLPTIISISKPAYLELTPSMAGLLPDKSDISMSSIKKLITIGETITKKVIDNWAGKLVNAYGPTEATLHASYSFVEKQDADPRNIGRPLKTCTMVIMDPDSTQLMPEGVSGELCVAGPQVAKGYLGRKDLTEAAFVFIDAIHGPVYRTGDLAKFQDSTVLFLGRKQGDTQVKINGQRIELGEVAHTIESTTGIKSCAVIKHSDRLYAFIVLQNETQGFDFSTIKRLPLDVKPQYITLPSIPVSSSGKRDDRQLATLAEESATEAIDEGIRDNNANEIPDSDVGRSVHAVVRKVIGHDLQFWQRFDRLGLDSLGAIKIVMMLRDLGLATTVFAVLDAGSALELTRRVARETSIAAERPDQGIPPELRNHLGDLFPRDTTFYPSSAIQTSMIAATLADNTGRLYYNHIALNIDSSVSIERLENAWHDLVQCHEILRTGFFENLDQSSISFVQLIHPKPMSPIVHKEIDSDAIQSEYELHNQAVSLRRDNLTQPALDVMILSSENSRTMSLMIHHSLYDAWSLELITKDLDMLLGGHDLPSRPQYANASDELSRLLSPSDESRAYWKAYLQEMGVPKFPILAQVFSNDEQKYRISKSCSMSLNDLDRACNRLGINPQVLGQLSWSIVLSRLTGESDVSLAMTTSGRTLAVDKIEQTLGPFITTFPFAWHSDPNMTVSTALEAIADYNRNLNRYSMSYRDILRCSGHDGSPDTLFIYQKTGVVPGEEEFVRISDQEDRLEFAVVFTLDRQRQGLLLQIHTDESHVSRGASKTILDQTDILFRQILQSPSQTVAQLLQNSVTTDLGSISNAAPKPAINGQLNEIVETTAVGEKATIPALQFYDSIEHCRTLSYEELNGAANKLANAFADEYLLPDDIIAICLDKSVEMYASILAIMKLGCAYLALEPSLPEDRVNVILEMMDVKLVYTDTKNISRFRSQKALIAADILSSSFPNSFQSRPSGGLAYILMTSGTTGLPKACLVTHSNVLSNCDALSGVYPHSEGDRMMQFTSYAFDVSVFEIFFSWYNRMCLVAAPRDLMLSNLTKVLQSLEITHLNMTATAAALIRAEDLPAIKCFITSGEASTRSIIQDWGASQRYYNAYGPTETTNVCSARLVTSRETYPSSIGPILENSSAYVLDVAQQVLPLLSYGELYVGGAQVIRGYKDEQRTKQSFIDHPQFGRIYRTGDVVRMLEDGSIFILGRADSQVKVRGHRVELDEVSHSLKDNDAYVKDAATLLFEGSLLSFVQLHAGLNVQDSVQALFDSLSRSLPGYMVPAYIIPLEGAIPLTSTYKLDSRKLIATYQASERLSKAGRDKSSEPQEWTDLSRKVAQLFSEISGVSLHEIGPGTSILSLGLDSISAIKISAAMNKQGLGLINVSTIMSQGSAAGISKILENEQKETPSSNKSSTFDRLIGDIEREKSYILSELRLSTQDVDTLLPCTPLQEGILLETLRSREVNYINHSIIELQLDVDPDRLEQACKALVRQTESLRTCFAFTSNKELPCVQVILKNHEPDFQKWSKEKYSEALKEWKAALHENMRLDTPPLKFLYLTVESTHYLIMSLHHSLFDGWSLSLLHEDLEALYFKETVPSRPLTSDVVAAICNSKSDHERNASYWRTQFANFEATAMPSISNTTNESQIISVSDIELPLKELLSTSNASSRSVLSILQACWAIVLSQISGVGDVCFANVVSGRTFPIENIEQATTPLFNVLPIRADFAKLSDLNSLTTLLNQTNLALLENPHYPLRNVLQAASLSPNQALFDTILILQQSQKHPETRLIRSITDDGDNNYRLMLEFIPQPYRDRMQVRLTARNNVVPLDTLNEISGKLSSALELVLRSPTMLLQEVVVSSSETDQAISRPATPLQSDDLLHSAFLRHAEASPNSTAIEYLTEDRKIRQMTYAALAQASLQTATGLLQHGLTSCTPVIVMLSKVPDLYVAFLGILQAGMVYTPLSVDTPEERLRLILAELQPGAILVDNEMIKGSLEAKYKTLPLVIDIQSLQEPPKSSVQSRPSLHASDLAYIIYTSGSTGRPKAVMIQHSAAVAAIASSKDILPITSESKWLQFASLTFDMSIYDMSVAFSLGICLCAAPRTQLLNDLSGVINVFEATHLDLTPSVARTLHRKELPSVKLLFCIGERLSQSIIDEWGSLCLNVYGPTEAAMACTSQPISSTSLPQDIGIPFKHVQVAIFAINSDNLLARYSLGELCISGPQLSTGYLKDKEKNEASYFQYNGNRFYRTGDLCRMLSQGHLAFVDRKDNQAKLRGQRIELDEISSVLVQCLGSKTTASTIVVSTDQQIEQLISFVASKENRSASTVCQALAQKSSDKLMSELEQRLPPYMIPAHIIHVNFIPMNAAQKVDRRSLLEVWKHFYSTLANQFESEEVETFTENESIVREVLGEISGTETSKISKKTSIYALGLDSISTIQIAAALKKKGLDLSVVDILQNPTIAKLSSLNKKSDNTKPIENENRSEAVHETYTQLQMRLATVFPDLAELYPCTPVQENMIAQFLQSEGHAYYNHLLLKLENCIDLDRLQLAWKATWERFDILRAGFVAADLRDCQYALVIHATSMWDRTWRDIDAPDLHAAVDRCIDELTRELLDDDRKPSFKLSHISFNNQNYLLWSAHHALYDGHSLDMILSHVSDIYHGQMSVPFDDLKTSSKQVWSLYHDSYAQQGAKSFWREQLEAANPTHFPNLSNRTETSKDAEVEHLSCSQALSEIEKKCRESGRSLANIALTVWAKLLSSYTGEESVAFGAVLSGRTGLDLASAAYPCITTLPYTCLLHSSADETVKQFEDLASDSLSHQHISLNELQKQESSSLFDTLFVFQKKTSRTQNTPIWTVERDIASVEVPISIEVLPNESSNKLDIALTFQIAKLPQAHARIILKQFEEILYTICEHPDENILDLELHISQGLLSILQPKRRLLEAPVKLVHDYVSYYARETPDSVAFEFADDLESEAKVWTYRQLEDQANQLANHLTSEYHLSTAAPIAICFDKCPQGFISILAVLKTGSPFCCLDASAPIDRKKFIIEDSGASAVLCGATFEADLSEAVEVTVIPIVSIDDLSTSTKRIRTECDEDSLCYILYTSGSTGTPKGCCLSHRSVVQGLTSFQTEFCGRFNRDMRFLAFASLHFDVSILETYFSWSVGGRVCAAPKDALLSDIPGAIAKFGITHLDLTPQLAMTLLREEAQTLQVFITGGEMLRKETVDHWGDSGALFNFYGPTEATIGCTALKQVRKGARPSNIGQQFVNCGSIVRSQLGVAKPALRGAVGDLIISGTQVAEGYMNLEKATRKRFEYNDVLKDRTYDTGDLVRLLEVDLSFDFVGRADSQIKLRGQRIETGEIDSVLIKSSSYVNDAVTLVLKHPSQQKEQLISFVVFKSHLKKKERMAISSSPVEVDDQFAACRSSLSGYMIPSYIVPLTSIELTPTNKVDTKKIKALYENIEPNTLPSYAAHRSAQSTAVVDQATLGRIKDTLREMTGIKEIDDHSSAFELGLDSVSIVGLVRKLRAAGFQGCSVSTVMTSGDVVGLAASLSSSNDQKNSSLERSLAFLTSFKKTNLESVASQLNVNEGQIEELLPCPPLIEGLLVETMQHSRRTHVNQFPLHGKNIDSRRIRQAFAILVAHTPVLRSRFVLVSDGLAQAIVKDVTTDLTEPDSAEFPLKSTLVRLVEQSFDGGVNFSVEIHHALYDGYSLDLMLHDLQRLYEHTDHDIRRPPLQPVVTEILALDMTSAKHFWTSQLEGAVARTLIRTGSGITAYARKLDFRAIEIEHFAKSHRCAPNIVYQTAWALLLNQLLGGDAIYALIVDGRNLSTVDTNEVAYPTFNTLPMSPKTESVERVADVIKALQQSYGSAIDFQHTPLREIKKAFQITSETSLMDTVFVYQKEAGIQAEASSGSLSFSDNTSDASGFAIALDVTVASDDTVTITVKAEEVGIDSEKVVALFTEVLRACLKGQDITAIKHDLRRINTLKTTFQHLSSSEKSFKASEDADMSDSAEARNLISIVAELTGQSTNDLSPSESFFTLGLDSIDIVKLSARMKQRYSYVLSVNDIMQNSSVTALCTLLQKRSQNEEERTVSCVPENFGQLAADALKLQYPFDHILPASPIQGGMLTMSQSSNDGLYLNHSLVRLSRNVSEFKLNDAWNRLINNNDILRTSFSSTSGVELPVDCTFVQIVHRKSELEILKQKVGEEALENTFEIYRKESVSQSLKDGIIPLFLKLFITEKATYLAISIHHALYDGASLDLMFQDLETYIVTGKETKDRPPYSILVNHILQRSPARADLFWAKYLKICQPKLQHAKADSDKIRSLKFERNSSVDLNLAKKASRELGVSLQSLVQTSFAKLLMIVSKSTDVLFGTINSGRSFESDADQILGPCMNTIPLRARIQKRDTIAALAKDMHTANVEMIEYIHTPLRRIQKQVGKGPLFETLLVFQNSNEQTRPLSIWTSVMEDSSVEFPLAIECNVTQTSLEWTLAIHEGYWDSKVDVLAKLDEILSDTVSDPSQLVLESESPLFSTSESTNGSDNETSDELITDDVEAVIARTLSSMTNVPIGEIYRKTSIFSLGLDSISVIDLSKRLKKNNMTLSVGEILRNPCIKDIARVLGLKSAGTEGKVKSTYDSERQPNVELSCADVASAYSNLDVTEDVIGNLSRATAPQIYFLSSWTKLKYRRFMSTFAFTLNKDVTIQTIEYRWQKLCADHGILRTGFVLNGDKSQIIQCEYKKAQSGLTTFKAKSPDLSSSLEEFFRSDALKMPDLRKPPVMLYAVTTTSSETALVLFIHHALYDGTSLPMIISALQTGTELSPELSYAEYSTLCAAEMNTNYWTEYLKDTTPFHLPPRKKSLGSSILRTIGMEKEGEQFDYFSTRARPVSSLDDKSARHGVTAQSLLLSSIARALSRLTRRDRVILGIYSAGRSLDFSGLHDVMGPTVNIVPIHFDSDRADSLIALSQMTHETLIELNGGAQVVPVSEIYEGLAWSEIEGERKREGGLVDVTVNILPRRSHHRQNDNNNLDNEQDEEGKRESSCAFEEYGRLKPHHINILRSKFLDSHTASVSSIHGFTGLAALDPRLDIEIEVLDGNVNFGVFGDSDVMSPEDAEDFVSLVWRILVEE